MNGMYLYDRRCAGEEKNMETKNLSEPTVCCFGDSTTWGDNGCGGGLKVAFKVMIDDI